MQGRTFRMELHVCAHHETVCEQLCIVVPFEKAGVVMYWLSHVRVRYAVTAAVCV